MPRSGPTRASCGERPAAYSARGMGQTVRAGGESHSGLQYALHEIVVTLLRFLDRACSRRIGRGDDARVLDPEQQAAVEGGGEIEPDAFAAHLLQLLVGDVVAVLDRVHAAIDRRLNAACRGRVRRDLQMLPVRLVDDRRDFGGGEVVVDRHLDDVDVVKEILEYRLSRGVAA